jgi:flavin reductase (DIM6/NTAB) family NADH-FMN oxidoreductase RutF
MTQHKGEFHLIKYNIDMKQIDIKQINDNVFETIGKEWILVAAGNKDKFNMMTASWGCLGWLWNKPVAVVFIRPERFTHELIEANDTMTLSFLGHSEEARKIYNFCGSKSGRDLDKCEATGLKPVVLEGGSIGFEQARLTLECRKLYKDSMSAEKFIDKDLLQWYGAKGGFHDVYVVEITHAYEE